MKKLIIAIFLIIPFWGTAQNIETIYPVESIDATDTIAWLRYLYLDGAIRADAPDTMTLIEFQAWLEAWEIWGQEQHNKWTTYQLRDSLFTDSIQALILKYVP